MVKSTNLMVPADHIFQLICKYDMDYCVSISLIRFARMRVIKITLSRAGRFHKMLTELPFWSEMKFRESSSVNQRAFEFPFRFSPPSAASNDIRELLSSSRCISRYGDFLPFYIARNEFLIKENPRERWRPESVVKIDRFKKKQANIFWKRTVLVVQQLIFHIKLNFSFVQRYQSSNVTYKGNDTEK